MERRIVITGMGMVCPLGCGVSESWENVIAGKSGIVPIRSFDATGFRCRIAGHLPETFTTDGYLEPKDARHLDTNTKFGIVAGIQAFADSGLDMSRENPLRGGCFIGSGIGGLATLEEQEARYLSKGVSKISPFTIPRIIPNSAAGHLSIRCNLQGPSYAVVSACASAGHSMEAAMDAIRLNRVDFALTGGCEGAVVGIGVGAFSAMRALSERNDEPEKASRPFDRDRDGFVMGEGSGVLVFEELEHAKKRGAKIYAEVLGAGSSSDAFHIVQPSELGDGAAHAIRFALADAHLNPEQIDYINAHGTSTHLGDIAETNAIKKVFGGDAYRVNVSSTKSQTGHLLGASGAVEMIFSVLAIQNGVIPPTINLDTPDPQCDLNYTPNHAVERECNYVLSNSFGFGGHNSSLVVGKYR
ncbi:MAG: beta-ketoacyl-ACP synthase II [Planctomycetia bacterium]|nr:beta-ketoacyl-ACP synthase II [Planctomycetia bacterium]